MKHKMVVLITILLLSAPIYAQYPQSHEFGMGIQVGEPTGLNAKLWTNRTNAFNFGVAWSFEGRDEMILQTNYLWHDFDVFPVSTGKLPLYYGIGGRAILRNDPIFSVAIPVGISYIFESTPIDLFLEIAPMLNLTPETDFDVGGGLGIRFWF